ncbi:MAG TPA: choice-of-anchor tandem repeat GloVer-containing protein [Solimonas sp.]|nr:choice-of-anchor tandem repeat GloVer-containing protein [Solimonas sp.]
MLLRNPVRPARNATGRCGRAGVLLSAAMAVAFWLIPLPTLAAGTVVVLHAFEGVDGSNPRAPLVDGPGPNSFGTSYRGASGFGTVFMLSADGSLTTLHSFNGSDGANPSGSLAQAKGARACESRNDRPSRDCESEGIDILGTTERGGQWGAGTAFKVTPGGRFLMLHAFHGTDGSAPNGLVRASDGNFYGTTQGGGDGGRGTVFRMTRAGVLTTLHHFAGPDGATPRARLIEGRDGNLYGTTEFGGSFNSGAVFRMGRAGDYSTLHEFGFGSDGALPLAGLVQGSDGNFYGTTYQGARGYGTVFRLTPAGELTTLHAFYPPDGEGGHPYGALQQGADHYLYGTTEDGGSGGVGTLFRISPAGSLVVLHSFSGGWRQSAGRPDWRERKHIYWNGGQWWFA